ncbi:hypothetical protein N9T15_01925 [Pelagibacteraceae bacterium]|nr:hypothetical protein [Pelagibacteraceae bacterium]
MLPQFTYPTINISVLNDNKPLLVCDADEVIFDFMTSFEKYLNNQNLYFSWNSYALEGNILDNNNNQIHKDFIKEIINEFFKANTCTMNLMKGAKNSLKKLSSAFNIIVLSNIPFDFYDDRLKALKNNNLNFPFYANKGPKGKIMKKIAREFKNNVWFIDDSPFQVKSVQQAEKRIKTILFVGNSKLEKLIQSRKYWDFFSNKWKKNEEILLNMEQI